MATTTLISYLLLLSEDSEAQKKYLDDLEAALAESGLSEEHKALLVEYDETQIREALIAEAPDWITMNVFMVAHVVHHHRHHDVEPLDPPPS